MTTTQAIKTSVTLNNNSPIQDYVYPDDQTQPTFEMTLGSNLSHKKEYTNRNELGHFNCTLIKSDPVTCARHF